jgi:hypothetical protein
MTMITAAMSATMMPYSTAVAPVSSPTSKQERTQVMAETTTSWALEKRVFTFSHISLRNFCLMMQVAADERGGLTRTLAQTPAALGPIGAQNGFLIGNPCVQNADGHACLPSTRHLTTQLNEDSEALTVGSLSKAPTARATVLLHRPQLSQI